MKKIDIYDTTLRDGSQGEGVSFSVGDKILIAKRLDVLGIPFIEGGWPGANPKDIAFFKEIKRHKLKTSQVVAFGSTRRAHTKPSDDVVLGGLLASATKTITIFGKSWDMHVRDVFKVELDENLKMINDSVRYLRSKKRQVVYDAEHFFDGYKSNSQYALKSLEAAAEAGASALVLCDTNGGSMPSEVQEIVSVVKKRFSCDVGIHTHNDCGLAIANAIAAVQAGATHVQGTINGLGERCGNADLLAIIASLQLKLGYACVAQARLKELTETSRYIHEICNMLPVKNQAYVGQSAFAHKGGVHINAVMKNPQTYEHIDPMLVGNRRRFLVSELGGKTNVMLKARELEFQFEKESPQARMILEAVQKKENEGYQYEAAEASFDLLMREVLGKRKKFFTIVSANVSAENIGDKDPVSTATVKLMVGQQEGVAIEKGDGPVNALDKALRKALERFYPQLKAIVLDDYKVRVVNSDAGTAAKVRVFIEFKDQKSSWTTVGVSGNIIEASWQALVDAFEYKLMK